MNLVLMTSTKPENHINKTPSTVTTLAGVLKEGTSVTDPVILIQAAALPSCNYAQIPEFNRFYFVRDIGNVKKDLWEVHLHVDVLFTYKNAILNAPCIITKTASFDFNLYLPDPNFKCQQNTIVGMDVFPFGIDINNPYYYLTFFG